MRHSVDVLVDELADTLRRTAEYLGRSRIQLERLTTTPGRPVRVTALLPANASEAEPATPFHWQADGAGEERAG